MHAHKAQLYATETLAIYSTHAGKAISTFLEIPRSEKGCSYASAGSLNVGQWLTGAARRS